MSLESITQQVKAEISKMTQVLRLLEGTLGQDQGSKKEVVPYAGNAQEGLGLLWLIAVGLLLPCQTQLSCLPVPRMRAVTWSIFCSTTALRFVIQNSCVFREWISCGVGIIERYPTDSMS
jgi:hypothetical protein